MNAVSFARKLDHNDREIINTAIETRWKNDNLSKMFGDVRANHDDVYLQFGTVKFYDHCKFFCCFCGKNYVRYERAPDSARLPKTSYQILNELAFDQKYFRDEEEHLDMDQLPTR